MAIPEDRRDEYNYLESVRRTGLINMCGAAPHLAEAFDLDRNTAREIVLDWMRDYDPSDYGPEL